MRYHVELRRHDEEGDYSEDHYAFHTREECVTFAKKNSFNVHSVHDYEDRDYDPINLRY